jgi:hypothetical protein
MQTDREMAYQKPILFFGCRRVENVQIPQNLDYFTITTLSHATCVIKYKTRTRAIVFLPPGSVSVWFAPPELESSKCATEKFSI